MALRDVSWGAWDYGSGNGMRVGLAVYWSAVSNTSTTVTATIEIWTGNQYNHDGDNQVLTYANNISGTTSYVNDEGTGTSTPPCYEDLELQLHHVRWQPWHCDV